MSFIVTHLQISGLQNIFVGCSVCLLSLENRGCSPYYKSKLISIATILLNDNFATLHIDHDYDLNSINSSELTKSLKGKIENL